MNITTVQLHCIRRLLTRSDKMEIAEHLQMSFRTIEAVMNGDRANDNIEQAVVRQARRRVAQMARVLAAIDVQNTLLVMEAELITCRNSPAWQSDDYYPRYNDIYIRLCGSKWEIAELWEVLITNYKDILPHGTYCCDMLSRLVGVTDKESVNYYNGHIKY